MRRNNKYNSQKCNIGNEVFDSRREARRYSELCLLEKAGQIKNLQRQVKFVLIPAQKESFVIPKKDGTLKLSMRVVERECSYIADFVYEENGMIIVEDTKGYKTKDYIIKRKLMLYMNGIRIREV